MDRRITMWPGILALLISMIALGRASMDEHRSSTSQEPEKITKPREEFEKLAIKEGPRRNAGDSERSLVAIPNLSSGGHG